jgi:hypothetical protein
MVNRSHCVSACGHKANAAASGRTLAGMMVAGNEGGTIGATGHPAGLQIGCRRELLMCSVNEGENVKMPKYLNIMPMSLPDPLAFALSIGTCCCGGC